MDRSRASRLVSTGFDSCEALNWNFFVSAFFFVNRCVCYLVFFFLLVEAGQLSGADKMFPWNFGFWCLLISPVLVAPRVLRSFSISD